MQLEYRVLVGWNHGEPKIMMSSPFGYVTRASVMLAPDKKEDEVPAIVDALKSFRIVPAFDKIENVGHVTVCEKLVNSAIDAVQAVAWEDRVELEMTYLDFVVSIKAERSHASLPNTKK